MTTKPSNPITIHDLARANLMKGGCPTPHHCHRVPRCNDGCLAARPRRPTRADRNDEALARIGYIATDALRGKYTTLVAARSIAAIAKALIEENE